MTPEAALYLAKASDQLRQAEIMISVALDEAAGRAAYLAGFHAVQGFLFEETGKVLRTHKGVQSEFGRLTRDDPQFDAETRAFLGRTYDLKAVADYGTGQESRITRQQSMEAVAAARLFVARLTSVLGGTSA